MAEMAHRNAKFQIKRQLLNRRPEKEYPVRYDSAMFGKLAEIDLDDLRNKYEKWKRGINYKTNRKITIGGKIHNSMSSHFMIVHRIGSQWHSVLFEDLAEINVCDYLRETEKMHNDVDLENNGIREYNSFIDGFNERINALPKWDDFIEFEGNYYGLADNVLNNIHRENDCLGEMVWQADELHECKGCRDVGLYRASHPCSCSTSTLSKCIKCGYAKETRKQLRVDIHSDGYNEFYRKMRMK